MRVTTESWMSVLVAGVLVATAGGQPHGGALEAATPINEVCDFFGTVIDASTGAPIAGASVTVNGVLKSTSTSGEFYHTVLCDDLDRNVVSVAKAGYLGASEVLLEPSLEVEIALKKGVSKTVATSGSTVISDSASGASLTLNRASLVDSGGRPPASDAVLTATVVNITPSDMPGDFTAVDGSGEQVALESVGAISAEVLDQYGMRYQLAPGATAVLSIPYGSAYVNTLSNCMATGECQVKTWSFDDGSALWVEQPLVVSFGASSATVTLVGSANSRGWSSPSAEFVLPPGRLGKINLDIEKKTPACTEYTLVGFSQICYDPNPADSTSVVKPATLTLTVPATGGGTYNQSHQAYPDHTGATLYNLPPYTDILVKPVFPNAACNAYAVSAAPKATAPGMSVNTGAPWGGTGVPDSSTCKSSIKFYAPCSTEVCDGKDNDCDGAVDEGLSLYTYYRDVDLDGFGASASGKITSCYSAPPAGYSRNSTDCNDASITTFPGAAEKESTSTCMTDADNDGYGSTSPASGAAAGKDCNDKNAAIRPGATEIVGDGIDQNCDGRTVWSQWFDRDNPGGDGDYELLSNITAEYGYKCGAGLTPVSAECYTVASPSVSWTATGEVYSCTPTGGSCTQSKQPDLACLDYKVRFACYE